MATASDAESRDGVSSTNLDRPLFEAANLGRILTSHVGTTT